VAAGNPWWANWFPTTKNPPEGPRYFWRGGQPPP
jgi:phospholipid/cholesterol/gamma-HCH transport system substrate-binding protein